MFEEHENFISPPDINQKIWRYTNFLKFVDLIDSKQLFFSRADTLPDIFEGSLPTKTANYRNYEYSRLVEEGKLRPEYKDVLLNAKHTQQMRRYYGLNCWHMNDHESAAMWSLYSRSGEGIAIQSTYKRLIDSFHKTPHAIHDGVVKYLDYENQAFDNSNTFNAFLHKRKSFEHERELRACIWVFENKDGDISFEENSNIKIDVDLNILIENIFISPGAPEWIRDLMNSVLEKYGINKGVIKSDLDREPVF